MTILIYLEIQIWIVEINWSTNIKIIYLILHNNNQISLKQKVKQKQ